MAGRPPTKKRKPPVKAARTGRVGDKQRARSRPVSKWKEHKEGATAADGGPERSAMIVEYSMEMKAHGYSLRDIAQGIAERFNCDPPLLSSVSKYIAKGHEDSKESREQWTHTLSSQYAAIIRKCLPLGLKDQLSISRLTKVDGEWEKALDENAVKEQVDFLNTALKAMKQLQQLLGIGLVDRGEKEMSEKEMREYVMAAVMGTIEKPVEGVVVEQGGQKLELESGLEGLEIMHGQTSEIESV